MNVSFVFIFYYPYEITTRDGDEPLGSSSFFFFLGVKNDNELGGSFSSICFFS